MIKRTGRDRTNVLNRLIIKQLYRDFFLTTELATELYNLYY